jgi:hypothetical protein
MTARICHQSVVRTVGICNPFLGASCRAPHLKNLGVRHDFWEPWAPLNFEPCIVALIEDSADK